jgi:hypothetical protein
MKKYAILFILFIIVSCSRPHTITKEINPENIIHYSQLSKLEKFSDLRSYAVYLDKGDRFPLYLTIDTNTLVIPEKMIEVEAKRKLFFMLAIPENLSDEEIDELNKSSDKEKSEIVISGDTKLLEQHMIYVSKDAIEWAPINDFDALKDVFDSKGGSLSLGVGVTPKTGISSHLEIKEDR